VDTLCIWLCWHCWHCVLLTLLKHCAV